MILPAAHSSTSRWSSARYLWQLTSWLERSKSTKEDISSQRWGTQNHPVPTILWNTLNFSISKSHKCSTHIEHDPKWCQHLHLLQCPPVHQRTHGTLLSPWFRSSRSSTTAPLLEWVCTSPWAKCSVNIFSFNPRLKFQRGRSLICLLLKWTCTQKRSSGNATPPLPSLCESPSIPFGLRIFQCLTIFSIPLLTTRSNFSPRSVKPPALNLK